MTGMSNASNKVLRHSDIKRVMPENDLLAMLSEPEQPTRTVTKQRSKDNKKIPCV